MYHSHVGCVLFAEDLVTLNNETGKILKLVVTSLTVSEFL